VFVDFFGEPTSTNKSIARVAMKTGASVVPVFLVREKDKFRVFIDKIVETVDTGCKNDDVKVNTENYNKIIEKYIKKYPSQWFWVHDRWKHKLLENG
ncbi:MAG: lysophospholipid acyltransferase family protein, partial [Desulfobacterales bacterium]|nr:lysophospholipid acyltransferase family protein [Desulfobacterales bacterium]